MCTAFLQADYLAYKADFMSDHAWNLKKKTTNQKELHRTNVRIFEECFFSEGETGF